MSQYFITYGVMDTEAGANPFGHAFLLFSKQNQDKGPIEVVDSLGHYSQPTTTTNLLVKSLKRKLGLSVDLQDTHGVLKKEAMRDLDGSGLRGISIEVPEEKFNTIHNDWNDTLVEEQTVVDELNGKLKENDLEPTGPNRLILEQELAREAKRELRLKRFHLALKLTFTGIDSSESYMCKDRALDVLLKHHLIDNKTKEAIYASKFQHTFPRFSALYLPPIRLLSKGDLASHKSARTGEVYRYSNWENNQLYWATPIQTLSENDDLDNRRTVQQLHDKLKATLNGLRDAEIKILNKIETPRDKIEGDFQEQLPKYTQLLNSVKQVSEKFCNVNDNNNPETLNALLLEADAVLAISKFTLNPDATNYSFMARAINDALMQHALIGVVAISAMIALVNVTPVVVLAAGAASLYSARNAYTFFKDEGIHQSQRQIYLKHIQNQAQETKTTAMIA